VAASLRHKVPPTSYHLNVGLLGTKALLNALSENGYADVALPRCFQRDLPFLGMVDRQWGHYLV